MTFYQIQNKQKIEGYLLKNAQVNFYHIGDLDDFFWDNTTWLVDNKDEIDALLLLYGGIDPVTFLAIENNNHLKMKALIQNVMPTLPKKMYSHLSPGYEKLFEERFTVVDHGRYLKMNWQHPEYVNTIDTEDVIALTQANINDLHNLYEGAYPGNWFDPRMLDTGQYVGVKDEVTGKLIGVAGVHVYSKEYEIAALGNITVDPNHRGKGIGSKLTAGLCKKLSTTVKFIGLNVRADNIAAITAYQKCGFEIVAKYGEWMLTEKIFLQK